MLRAAIKLESAYRFHLIILNKMNFTHPGIHENHPLKVVLCFTPIAQNDESGVHWWLYLLSRFFPLHPGGYRVFRDMPKGFSQWDAAFTADNCGKCQPMRDD